ncbi:hypothetical protein MLD38_002217 [Melastoma candidum]|uniref:Uncharacterized protein n=1 Tax=Melastoma candidum TaxID=119954 RepID=A0ACB9SJ19_9MYRT|nr:hypothetical protein MLD38_002217 [Melastoma candidum]
MSVCSSMSCPLLLLRTTPSQAMTGLSPTPRTWTTTRTGTRMGPTFVCLSRRNSNNGDEPSAADPPDRLISAVVYFYPFFDGIQYGRYLITQYPTFGSLIYPFLPSIRAFRSFPLNSFLVFVTLYFVVVRNQNFSRYVRFNTMQAIVLDVLLIFPELLERTFSVREGIGFDLLMSLDSTVFLYLLVCLVYGSGCCLVGKVPRLPIVAEAAEKQVL